MAPKRASWLAATSYHVQKYRDNIGLYRDDGLSAFNKMPQEIENIKKDWGKAADGIGVFS